MASRPTANGPVKVPQLGRVVIGDDVDIGANTTIDRGSGHDTVIGPGTMIDNLVQIGHNVVIGRGCVLAGQVGISGSTRLGDFVMAGGQAGFAGHLRIGSGARIAAKSGLMRDVAAGRDGLRQPGGSDAAIHEAGRDAATSCEEKGRRMIDPACTEERASAGSEPQSRSTFSGSCR